MEITYVDNLTDLTQARDDILGNGDELGVDTETTGFDALSEEMTLLQVAYKPGHSYVFNVRELNDPNDFEWVVDLLGSERVTCFQNAKFDLQFLRYFFGRPFNVENLYDTYIISQLEARGDKRVRHNLGEIAMRELGLSLDKSLQKSDFGTTTFSEEQLMYAGRDAEVLLSIRDSQKVKLTSYGLEGVARLECDAVAALADTEYDGFYLDPVEWTNRAAGQQARHTILEKEVYELIAPATQVIDLFGDPVINLDSPQQLGPALRNLGIKIGESTDEAALTAFKGRHPIIEVLLEYREMANALKKYGLDYLNFINPVDGRLHATFNQIEAPSGRMSVRKPALQTVPAEKLYRQNFKAQHGGKLITADYSQVELRIMAKTSGDPVLTQAYMDGEDLHNVTAVKVLGEPADNINPDRRRIAKNANFGTAYGVSAAGFAVTAGITERAAEQVLRAFWMTYSVLGNYLRQQASLAADHGRCYTMSGRSAVLFVDQDDKQKVAAARRLGRNFGIQGTGADILKLALYLFRKERVRLSLSAKIVNIVHDEIVVETEGDQGYAEYVAGILKATMVTAGTHYLNPIPCEVSIKIGDVWTK